MQAFALAEGPTHVAQSAKPRRAAFTLAEVLITLGIIGVVAALTLPTLISNYQKKVYVTQLKKSVSVLSQGFTTMMGHDGVTELKDTEAFSGITPNASNYCYYGDFFINDHCRSIKEGFEKVFSGIEFDRCDLSHLKYLNGTDAGDNATDRTCIKFPDGSVINYFYFYKTPQYDSTKGFVGYFLVDVNGPKNPNTLGRDIFELYLLNNGTVVGKSSGVVANLMSDRDDYYWRTTSDASYTCTTDGKGKGCAGRVLEEDAMNY